MDGRPVRLAGQDSRRGTFVQRFATIIDRINADEWTPLTTLTEDQAKFFIYDSLLSEYAALGFEYGYSVARPDALVLWEAQFGDFVNGAQTIIDEFITASETKWRQQSGVVLLLPHGYEGQGPDHSSARIERFMTMCADEAFVVAQPSTPASYFHLLRRHSLGEEHKPLVVFTPEVDAQAQGGRLAARRLHHRHVPAVHRRRGGRPGDGRHAADLLGTRHVGPDGGAGQAGGRRAVRDRPRGAALPASGRRHPGRVSALPEPEGGALGAGRAGEHGPVAALPAQRVARAGPAGAAGLARGLRRRPRSAPSSGTPRSSTT